MIIVIVEFDIAPENQAEALDVFARDSKEAQALAGCIAFTTTRVAGSKTGLMLLEEWEDMPAFEAYKATEGFARMNGAIKPLMLGAPRSRAFEASLATP